MKYLGILIIILALVAGILPQFTDCQSQGKALTLNNAKTVPMKCHWTAIAEIALAVPLGGVGGMLFFGKRKETRRALSILGAILGAFVVLIPTVLIGVCASDMMLCRSIMFPTLVLSGILVVAISLVFFASSFRMSEPVA